MTKTQHLNQGGKIPPSPPADASAASSGGRRNRMTLLTGRGGTGKTMIVRKVCETIFSNGGAIVIADGDRTNRSLPHYFEGVLSPPSSDHGAVKRWLEDIIERMIVEGFDVIVDLGGGDMVLKDLASEIDLCSMLAENGIDVLALHVIGPEIEHLAYLASVEAPGSLGTPLFAPERTALILNEALVSSNDDPSEVFKPIREHRVFRAALARGARAISMPRLGPAYEVNRRHLLFAAAAAGATSGDLPPLTFLDRQRVIMWTRAMDAAFADIAEWIL